MADSSGPESGLPSFRIDITWPRERADAARNRAKVVSAAERLFAELGVEGVTMDAVAAAAGVGKGTLYRRFGDKSGLAMALLGEREALLQGAILHGEPPLGPGAEPEDRLAAFTTAYLEFLDGSLDLVLLSETSTTGARFRTGVHAFWRRHCEHLFEQCDAPAPGIAADVLLAALSAEQVRHWRVERELPLPDLTAALTQVTRSLATRKNS